MSMWKTVSLSGLLAFGLSITGSAQLLKPTELIYSRRPTNQNASPSGANSPTIWAVGQDGSDDRQITTGTMPRVSDDGRFLLFKRFDRHPNTFNPFGALGDFWIRDLASGQETLIRGYNFDDNSIGHFFSPESNQGNYEIIFDFDCLMQKMNRDGTNVTYLYPTSTPPICYDDYPAVRRGGDQLIVFHNLLNDGVNGGLYTVSIGGANRTKVPNTSSGDIGPAWSNDNQFIGFGTLFEPMGNNFPIDAYPYFISNLYRITPNGSGRAALTALPNTGNCRLASTNCLTFGIVWNTDNTRIIAAGRINGSAGLYSFATDGSGQFAQIPISPGNAPDFVGGIVQPRVDSKVVSSGGGLTSGGSYSLVSTMGEPIAGFTSTGGQYSFSSGFWATTPALRASYCDFDGDGKADISVFRPSNNIWYLNRSASGFAAFQFGAAGDILTPADFTGDGKTDISVFRPSIGTWFVMRSEDNTFYGVGFGTSGDIPAPADFDGDGKADPAVFRPSTGTWFLQQSTVGFSAVGFGSSGDRPTAGDFDGDGKADIAVFRPSDGVWYRLNSSNGSFFAAQFGVASDKVVPADYTGDGKADIAVWRPMTGSWYILRSENLGFYGLQFGASSDLPAPGDYDGDGKTDIAVYRPNEGIWYMQLSTSGFSALQFGTAEDKPASNSIVR